MPQRLRWTVVLTVLSLMASPSGASAIQALPVADLPLLWSGHVLDPAGAPTAAEVTAFIRPPVAIIPTADSGAPAPPSLPLATTNADKRGHFELRAVPPVIPAEYRPDGWLNVMVLATAADGSWMVANDSMRFVHTGTRGVWLSTIAAEDRVTALRRTASTVPSKLLGEITDQDLNSFERPAALRLAQPGAKPASSRASGRWVGPGNPYVGCSALAVEGRENGFRTIADIDVGPSWSFVLNYLETKTTSWEIGVESSRGGWTAGGTTSFTDSWSGGFDTEFGPYPNRFRESYQVRLVHAKVLWRCGSRTSPGPFHIRTVEPESWTNGTFNQGEPIIPCNPRNREPVAGNTIGWRNSDKTSKYSSSVAAFGFSGAAAVTYSNAIKLGFHNFLGNPRDVCGESGHPYRGNTRVAAMDEHL